MAAVGDAVAQQAVYAAAAVVVVVAHVPSVPDVVPFPGLCAPVHDALVHALAVLVFPTWKTYSAVVVVVDVAGTGPGDGPGDP